jgi:hypothetical protein
VRGQYRCLAGDFVGRVDVGPVDVAAVPAAVPVRGDEKPRGIESAAMCRVSKGERPQCSEPPQPVHVGSSAPKSGGVVGRRQSRAAVGRVTDAKRFCSTVGSYAEQMDGVKRLASTRTW